MYLRDWIFPTRVVDAHCDIPCGVYDPEQARIEAESCLKILEKYHASNDEVFRQRCLFVKRQILQRRVEHLAVENRQHLEVVAVDCVSLGRRLDAVVHC